MSTKVFNAYKYNGTIVELYNLLRALRLELLPEMEDSIFQRTVDCAHRYTDYKEAFSEVMRNSENQTKAIVNATLDDLDFKLNCSIYLDDETIVTHFFIDASNRRFKKVFDEWITDNPLFSDYHFQNQADPYFDFEVEDFSVKELKELKNDWEKRSEFYNKIFTCDFSSPSVAGLNYTLIEYMDVAVSASSIFERLKKKYEKI
jgi:hypothetical protein